MPSVNMFSLMFLLCLVRSPSHVLKIPQNAAANFENISPSCCYESTTCLDYFLSFPWASEWTARWMYLLRWPSCCFSVNAFFIVYTKLAPVLPSNFSFLPPFSPEHESISRTYIVSWKYSFNRSWNSGIWCLCTVRPVCLCFYQASKKDCLASQAEHGGVFFNPLFLFLATGCGNYLHVVVYGS